MSYSAPLPLVYMGDGEFHAATPYYAKRASEQFEEGKKYLMSELHERSPSSHDHYFCAMREAWMNLPDSIAPQFANEDILRAHALIETGYFVERRFIASSPAEARRIAAFLRPQSPKDAYAIISVNGPAVVERRAMSQSYRAMGREVFQSSKTDTLEFVWALVGVDPEVGNAEAGKVA